MERRMPRWSELRELARPRPFTGDATDRRLAAGGHGRRTCARSRGGGRRGRSSTTPTAPPARRSACAGRGRRSSGWSSARASCGTSPPSTRRRTLLGAPSALPFALRADRVHPADAHRGGDRGRPRRRADRASPTPCRRWAPRRSRRSPTAAPGARRWFQLYLWRDREASAALVERARAAGYEALVLTVDTPVAGPRLRDVRNGFTIPPGADPADGRQRRRPPARGGSTC